LLILSRKAGTRLVIDGNVVISVVKVTAGRVTLGIEAPASISVRRSEAAPQPTRQTASRALVSR